MIAYIRFSLALTILVIITLFLVPVQYLALKTGLRIARLIPLYWHRFALWLVGMKVSVKGNIEQNRPLMIIANHTSWTDIPVLGSIMELCFIAKQEVGEMPGAGLLARMQRTVFVKREEKRAVGKQVDEITERLVSGDVMVLFGEGSTGNGSKISAFKSSLLGAAQYAIANTGIESVTIQPVSIAYTGLHGIPLGRYTRTKSAWYGVMDLAPHAFFVMLKSAWNVEVTFGDPIVFTSDSNRRMISQEAQAQVRSMFLKSVHQRGDEIFAVKEGTK